MSYQITLSLVALSKDRIVRTLTPEDAAQAAWKLCVEYNLNMPNPSWKMKTWDTFEGAYENIPVTDNMVRGCAGNYPDKVEFMHAVIDALTKNPHAGSHIMMMSRMPHTPAPESGKFEMSRGRNSLIIEYMEDSPLLWWMTLRQSCPMLLIRQKRLENWMRWQSCWKRNFRRSRLQRRERLMDEEGVHVG
mmetsp:Transcript_10682/g.15757  ORF Transcript_10682/g.15757 Transcript_10682/m.15757 type:complete len:190 (+) Transcript_10682:130-699(+)